VKLTCTSSVAHGSLSTGGVHHEGMIDEWGVLSHCMRRIRSLLLCAAHFGMETFFFVAFDT
jgi:hypothetical protein